MTLINISAAQYISGKLRTAVNNGDLIDFNAINRSSNYGNWIYPDKPLIAKLLGDKNNFPRISVESADVATAEEMGMDLADHEDTVVLTITAWTVRDLICDVVSVVAEGHTFHTGTDEYPLTELPVSSIGAVSGIVGGNPYTFIHGTDYALIDADGDGMRDTIDWSLLGTDPDDDSDFDVTYARKASGPELARLLIQNIHSYIRRNWRLWTGVPLYSYSVRSSMALDFDTRIGVYRHELIVQFNSINTGESI